MRGRGNDTEEDRLSNPKGPQSKGNGENPGEGGLRYLPSVKRSGGGWKRRRRDESKGSHPVLSESVGEGADTSFDDVLDIVVPHATYGSSNTVAYGTSRLLAASEQWSPLRI